MLPQGVGYDYARTYSDLIYGRRLRLALVVGPTNGCSLASFWLLEGGIMSFAGHAAVMVITRSFGEEPCLLLTERAAHLAAHPGEIALPGGKWEVADNDLLATALRETEEEVAIPPAALRIAGTLPRGHTGSGVPVSIFVAELQESVELRIDPTELSAAFWLPERELLRDARVRTDVFERDAAEYWAPAYHYQQYHIWGFTARVLVQFMNIYRQAGIERRHGAPVFRYKV